MKLLLEENFDKKVQESFDFYFDIETRGLHLIEITARAKNWLQNATKFFRDDNLAMRLDGMDFHKLSGERGIFDGEMSWNGNKLKNLSQTNFILSGFNPGRHSITFLLARSPFLENLRIYGVDSSRVVLNVPSVENGNRRPLATVAIFNAALESLKIIASIGNNGGDDDDLQLRINGEIERNVENKAHQNWFWCGRVLRGQVKSLEKKLNFELGMHYIELWADGKPNIQSFEFFTKELKRIPSKDNPLWTGDLNDDPDDVLLTRLIFGEARSEPDEAKIWVAGVVLNRKHSSSWPDTLKEVILQPKQFKALDPMNRDNFNSVVNPLRILSEKDAWYGCHQIAVDAISGQLEGITEATHFHDKTQSQSSYIKNVVPNGRFIKKIGTLYFYQSPN